MFHPVYHALLVAPHLENVARPGRLLDRQDIYCAITPQKKTTGIAHFNRGTFKHARRRARSAKTVSFPFSPKTVTRPSDSMARATIPRSTRARSPSVPGRSAPGNRPCGTPLNHQPVRICNSRPQPDACTGLTLDRYRTTDTDTRYAPRAAGFVFLAVAAMRVEILAFPKNYGAGARRYAY